MRSFLVALASFSLVVGCGDRAVTPTAATPPATASPAVVPSGNPVNILLIDWSELSLSNQSDGRLQGPISLEQLRESLELTPGVEWTAQVVLAKNARIGATPESCRSIASTLRGLGFRRVTIAIASGVFSTEGAEPSPVLFDTDRDK